MIVAKRVENERELMEAYRIRFQVYCLERKFLSSQCYPDYYEADEYDSFSRHFILTINGQTVGACRLILDNPLGFPIERHYGLDAGEIGISRNGAAEISRFVLSKDKIKALGYKREKIVWEAFKNIYSDSIDIGIKHYFAVMERSLWRLLDSCGITFNQIGAPQTYYGGLCFPFLARVHDLATDVMSRNIQLFQYVTDESSINMLAAAQTVNSILI